MKWPQVPRRIFILSGTGAGLVAALTLFVTHAPVERRSIYEPRHALRSGKELVLVFIGSSSCGADRVPGFDHTIEQMKVAIAERASHSGYRLDVVGVALDWGVKDGLRFLSRYGSFDEVMIGRNWLNAGVIQFIWNDLPKGPVALPQVLVLRRRVGVRNASIEVGPSEFLYRAMGTKEIIRWVSDNVPIESL
jgi:hypothetical protein